MQKLLPGWSCWLFTAHTRKSTRHCTWECQEKWQRSCLPGDGRNSRDLSSGPMRSEAISTFLCSFSCPPFFYYSSGRRFRSVCYFFLPLFSVCHSKRCETELGRAVSERPHALWSSVRIGLNRMNIGKLKSRAILSLGSSLRCFSLKKQDLFT